MKQINKGVELLNTSMVTKVISVIFLTGLFGFFGFIGVVFSALMGGVKFYTPLIAIVTVGIILYSIVRIFNILQGKKLKIAVISFVGLCVLAIGGYEITNAYHNSFGIVNAEVNLYQYHPFYENSKVVTLSEPASLKLEKELPILDGATALYPLYSAFVRATYPNKEYEIYQSEVMSSKTGEAYTKLINGHVDIIFAAGPSDRQLRAAEQKVVELKLTPIGREAFVFFVSSKNTVESLTIDQIQSIYTGEITNWNQLGGKIDSIRAFQRPADSGSQTALENLMGEKPLMKPPTEDIVSGMGGIISETSSYRNYKNAIGYSFRFFSTEMVQNGEIRHLKINGVFPDKETIRSGEYPISSEFYAITAGSDNPHIDAFIEWILSEQGQYLVEATGYIPVGD
ncbi:substrate-binding domain-containing protein [Anaerobacillus sp. CMMVII]|uniref:PstS family phosphate ABC transporter substrate-binding protein n=1 Tax=Anaerobacillus sp. CMMVII TaxID=2755588 RepID=UPI0021B770BF|nr:substrate-binding domain-containing protein [Anaerobacillus sp. CMMVII]MCT8138431.1 substrate-binding domain-containing protein [Anaerobacillus sp. CMMVII]